MNDIELSIIILCYCSGESIIDFVQSAERVAAGITESYEIILVGNYIAGSDDRTRVIVQALAAGNSRYKSVCVPKEGMMGWDMRLGLEAAAGTYLCVIDGDGQFPLESIERCYAVIAAGGYDLVKTYRSKRHDGLYRRLLSWVYNLMFRLLFPGLGSRDINSKPKMMTRRAYEQMQLRSDDWFIDAEIMLNVRKLRLTFFEFPIEFSELAGRVSFIKLRTSLEFIKNLILYRLNMFKKK